MPNSFPVQLRFLIAPLKYFYRLLYHSFAWTYDWIASIVSAGLWKDWVGSILPDVTQGQILEIGFGPGHLLTAISKLSPGMVGLDYSMQMGKIAQKHLLQAGVLPKIVRAKTQQIPFENDYFDQVISTFPSEYIFDPLTLSENFRILKPGGTLTILPYAWTTGKSILQQASAWLFKVTGQSLQFEERLIQLLITAGFAPITKKVKVKTSMVIIINAQKPPN